MFQFHSDLKYYFDINTKTANEFIMPFIKEHINTETPLHILDVGCGEGGILNAFLQKGHACVGIELDPVRLDHARNWLQKEIDEHKVKFMYINIFDINVNDPDFKKYDLIILKDVIEHIHNPSAFIAQLKLFLKPGGAIFFGFPPWQMPFGGHQQICKNKWLSRLPYYHLLPKPIYKFILKSAKENVAELMDIRETRITIERFERITKENGFEILGRKLFLVNPIYKYKFGWKPKAQFYWLSNLSFIRNFFTTCAYYIISPKDN